MKTTRITVTSLVAAVSAASLILPAQVRAIEFSMSGQVNRLIMNVDNGVESGVVHADNSNSGTRWRIVGEGEFDGGTMAGLIYETQLQSNPSDKVTADSLDSDGTSGNVGSGDLFSTRLANVWMKGNFGKVTAGQGSGATDGSAEVDDSGTTVIQYSGSSNDLLGSMEYGESGVTVGDARKNFDGLGRNDNLRYDAAFGDLVFAASVGNGDKIEGSLRYAGEQFKVMVGLWDENDAGGGLAGSAISGTWVHDSGFNISAAYGTDDREGDPDNLYLKLGFKQGKHAYGIDWSETSDLADGDATSWSVAWVGQMYQGVELYATYRLDSLDGVDDADDIDVLAGGARIKF